MNRRPFAPWVPVSGEPTVFVEGLRDTLTISLPAPLRREVAKQAKSLHLTQSECVRKAIQDKLLEDAVEATRRILVPKARAMGIYTDEDVFKIVS